MIPSSLLVHTLFNGLALVAVQVPQAAPPTTPSEFERADASGKARVRVKESIIGFNDPSMNQESFLSSHDGRRVAYMIMDGGGMAVVVDGNKGETFEGIAEGSLAFSPDGAHFGYVGTRPGKQYVVFDGQVHEYRGVSKQGVVFSTVGGRAGWVAAREGNWIAVVDGKESAPYDGIAPQGIVFSPDGKRYAFAALSGDKNLVVLDGEEGPLFDAVVGLKFSAHGQHAVYMAIRDLKRYTVIDTTPYGPFDDLRPMSGQPSPENPMIDVFEISSDGSRVGFVAKRGEDWYVFVDGVESGPFQGCAGLALSPEGSRVAYLATRGEGWFMMVDGEEHTGKSVQSLSFSPDGKRLASILKRGNKRLALIDGIEGKEYDRIEEPGIRFSSDGQHTTYIADLAGERLVVTDGVESPPFRRIGKTPLSFVPNGTQAMYSVRRGENEAMVIGGKEGAPMKSIRTLTFSRDGARHAYAAEKEEGHWIVVVDGVEYGPGGKLEPENPRYFQSLGKHTPLFSPDGKHVAWVGVRDTGWVAVVDGKESPAYNLVMRSTLDFSPDGQHFAFVGARDGKKMIVVDGFEVDNGWDGFLQKSDFVWDGPRRFSIRGSRNPRYLLIEVEIL
jgi:DNA-binding beta-propeller fold protein YncE